MGHYASEMGYGRRDEYDYAAVNAAGFEPARDSATRRVCPVCLCLVLGENALAHMEWHKPASEAVRAAEPRSGAPEGDGTSGGFEAVTEAHSDYRRNEAGPMSARLETSWCDEVQP